MSVTVRELAETLSGLRKLASELRETASSPRVTTPEGRESVVYASPEGLRSGARFLDSVCEELLQLMPDIPIEPLMEKD